MAQVLWRSGSSGQSVDLLQSIRNKKSKHEEVLTVYADRVWEKLMIRKKIIKYKMSTCHGSTKEKLHKYSHKKQNNSLSWWVTWILCPNAMLLSADTSWILWVCPSILILHTPSSTALHISAPWGVHTCRKSVCFTSCLIKANVGSGEGIPLRIRLILF